MHTYPQGLSVLSVLLLLLLSIPLEAAAGHAHVHRDVPVPKFFGGGRKVLSDLIAAGRAEIAAANSGGDTIHAQLKEKRDTAGSSHTNVLNRRQGGKDGQCGKGVASCAEGYCCSSAGWCGNEKEYCSAPDCQINYGSGCDGNKKPSGQDTSKVARTKVGDVPYGGAGIYDCVNPGDIAITYDDGPYNYTSDLLDTFAKYNAKATFFMTGNNLGKGMINDKTKPWAEIIKRMSTDGHQIASHTWSHENASQLTDTQYRNQIIWNEIAFNDILGFFPTYMRPPYSICEQNCQTILEELGYHITYFDLDTEGYLHDGAEIQKSKDIWDKTISGSDPATDDFLMIEHDIHWQVVYNLTEYVLKGLVAKGYNAVTVGECLGDPEENWYRKIGDSGTTTSSSSTVSATPDPSAASTTTNPSATSSGTLAISTSGACGKGTTCQGSEFGNCCSQYGWCGSTVDYCGEGCQPAFGTCPDS